jgi:hypothetical protein
MVLARARHGQKPRQQRGVLSYARSPGSDRIGSLSLPVHHLPDRTASGSRGVGVPGTRHASANEPLQRSDAQMISKYFDSIAITLSAVCILHCLALPLIVVGLPLVAVALADNGHFHVLMLWLVVPTSVAGFTLGYRLHAHWPIVVVGIAAMLVLVVVGIWGHDRWPESVEISATVLGSLVLGLAHWLNFRGVRRVHRHRA